jgi:hypothetical protein
MWLRTAEARNELIMERRQGQQEPRHSQCCDLQINHTCATEFMNVWTVSLCFSQSPCPLERLAAYGSILSTMRDVLENAAQNSELKCSWSRQPIYSNN